MSFSKHSLRVQYNSGLCCMTNKQGQKYCLMCTLWPVPAVGIAWLSPRTQHSIQVHNTCKSLYCNICEHVLSYSSLVFTCNLLHPVLFTVLSLAPGYMIEMYMDEGSGQRSSAMVTMRILGEYLLYAMSSQPGVLSPHIISPWLQRPQKNNKFQKKPWNQCIDLAILH